MISKQKNMTHVLINTNMQTIIVMEKLMFALYSKKTLYMLLLVYITLTIWISSVLLIYQYR